MPGKKGLQSVADSLLAEYVFPRDSPGLQHISYSKAGIRVTTRMRAISK